MEDGVVKYRIIKRKHVWDRSTRFGGTAKRICDLFYIQKRVEFFEFWPSFGYWKRVYWPNKDKSTFHSSTAAMRALNGLLEEERLFGLKPEPIDTKIQEPNTVCYVEKLYSSLLSKELKTHPVNFDEPTNAHATVFVINSSIVRTYGTSPEKDKQEYLVVGLNSSKEEAVIRPYNGTLNELVADFNDGNNRVVKVDKLIKVRELYRISMDPNMKPEGPSSVSIKEGSTKEVPIPSIDLKMDRITIPYVPKRDREQTVEGVKRKTPKAKMKVVKKKPYETKHMKVVHNGTNSSKNTVRKSKTKKL